jgi:hypothetical protein
VHLLVLGEEQPEVFVVAHPRRPALRVDAPEPEHGGRPERAACGQIALVDADPGRLLREQQAGLAGAQRRLRADPLHRRPASPGHFGDQRDLVGGPVPRRLVQHEQGGRQASFPDQWNADQRPAAHGREGVGGVRGEVVTDDVADRDGSARPELCTEGRSMFHKGARAGQSDAVGRCLVVARGNLLLGAVCLPHFDACHAEVAAQHFGRGAGHLAWIGQPSQALIELEQEGVAGCALPEASLRRHAIGGLNSKVEHAADGAVGHADRARAEGEPGVARRAIPGEREEPVLGRDHFPEQRLFEGQADLRPDLGEHLTRRTSERGRVLGAQELAPAVVVDEG